MSAVRAISPAAAGVTLSEGFVAAVHRGMPTKVRLALWVLREVTRVPDLVEAAKILQDMVDLTIRTAVIATDPGRRLPETVIPQIRGCVIDAILGSPSESGNTLRYMEGLVPAPPRSPAGPQARVVEDGRRIAEFLQGPAPPGAVGTGP